MSAPTPDQVIAAGKMLGKWRSRWGDIIEQWPPDKPTPYAPGVVTRLAMADDLAALLAAREAAAYARGVEEAARFVEREFDPGKHEATCPHPDEPCTCLLGEVATALRALLPGTAGR